MAIDIRATVSCNLGTVISGSIADDYLQGSGLIKTRGQVVLKGTLTPKIGRGVTFTYTKNGTTRSIPRKLRVLSSFADPFRQTTTIQLGCKLTYLSDLAEPVKETIAEQIPAVVYEELKTAISAPLEASGILNKCLEKLGLSADSNPLQNAFIAEEWDLSPGYVQVMSDLLVSESYFGYLDEDEELQIRDLTDDAGRGKLIEADDIVDLSPIGAGNLPGEAVIVNYSFRRLGTGSEDNEDELIIEEPVPEEEEIVNPEQLPEEEKSRYKRKWEFSESIGGISTHNIAFTTSQGQEATLRTRYIPYSMARTFYDEQDRVIAQWDETRSIGAAVMGGIISQFLQSGLYSTAAANASRYLWEGKYTSYEYNEVGEKTLSRSVTRISDAAMMGRLDIQAVWYLSDGTPSPLTFEDVSTSPPITGEGVDYADAEYQETYYYTSEDAVRTETYNYQAWGLTQEGQQAFSRQKGTWRFSDDFVDYFNENAFSLVPIPGQTTLSINRGQLVPKPRPPELAKAVPLSFPPSVPDEPGGGVTIETASSTLYALGSAEAERVVQFTMPVAPDDYWDTNYWRNGVAVSYPVVFTKKKSSAQRNAIKFGRVQNRLLLGNRNGISLQLAPERLPKRPFDPLYVKAGGITASYRVNGASWTFDANGIVASVDALLWGAVGADAGTDLASSWIPLAPDTTTLPVPPAVITPVTPEEIANAPEIAPVAVLPPYIETVPLEAVSHTTASIVVFNHALTTETETLSLVTRTRFAVGSVLTAGVGACNLSGQASTGRYVRGVAGNVGSFAVAGMSAGNVRSFAIGANAGTFTSSGQAAGLAVQRLPMPADAGAFALTGQAALLFKGISMSAEAGTFSAVGQAAGGLRGYVLLGGVGAVVTAGQDATLAFTPQPVATVLTYTGNGTSQSLAGAGFKPGFAHIARRDAASGKYIFDHRRGATRHWNYASSIVEVTSATSLTSFDTNGFSLGSDTVFNGNGLAYVSFLLKEGSANATNTNGSISTTVNANDAAGYSIFTYTGNGANGATIGHGLSAAPELVLIRNHISSGFEAVLGSSYVGVNKRINGNGTAAAADDTTSYQAFGSSTITLGTYVGLNSNTRGYVGYAFRSTNNVKVGLLNGTGLSTLAVNLGFRPSFLFVKSSAVTTSSHFWLYKTSAGDGFADFVASNSSSTVPGTSTVFSFTSTGFTVAAGGPGNTTNGSQAIYLAVR
jgi:hypothetical protein